MAKFKVESERHQTMIRCKLDWSEQIRKRDVDIFNERLIRGLMRPSVKGARKLEYMVPSGISLKEFLKKELTKDVFFMVFVQIVEIIKRVQHNGLDEDNLVLDLSYTFINESTGELYFVYNPIAEPKKKLDVTAFLCEMAYASVFHLDTDTGFINDMVDFLNKQGGFSVEKTEQYMVSIYPEIYSSIGVSVPVKPVKEVLSVNEESDYEMTAVNDAPSYEVHPVTEETVEEDDREEATVIIEEDEEETIMLMDEDVTALLMDEEMEDTRIIDEVAYLIRIKTSERIDICEDIFAIGKDPMRTSYAIADNGAISRVHAEIIKKDGCYYIKDNNSTNGSYVDEEMTEPGSLVEIADGNELMLANEKFEFHVDLLT